MLGESLMKQSKSQNSKIFDGKYLSMEKNSVMYKYGKKSSLGDALASSVKGKRFKNIKDAFKGSQKDLEKLYG